jgi:hypothetical protein
VHMQAMQFQMLLRKLGGARPVPAATAVAGRHDPRLHPPEQPAHEPVAAASDDGSPAAEAADAPGRPS